MKCLLLISIKIILFALQFQMERFNAFCFFFADQRFDAYRYIKHNCKKIVMTESLVGS